MGTYHNRNSAPIPSQYVAGISASQAGLAKANLEPPNSFILGTLVKANQSMEVLTWCRMSAPRIQKMTSREILVA